MGPARCEMPSSAASLSSSSPPFSTTFCADARPRSHRNWCRHLGGAGSFGTMGSDVELSARRHHRPPLPTGLHGPAGGALLLCGPPPFHAPLLYLYFFLLWTSFSSLFFSPF